eukprot:6895159-Karenia_brevis.AAC.1
MYWDGPRQWDGTELENVFGWACKIYWDDRDPPATCARPSHRMSTTRPRSACEMMMMMMMMM